MTSHVDRFTSLPKELICEIIHPLIRRDLKSLRIQNHKLNAIVCETLFRTITLQETESSIRQLGNVASSPTWSHQVETVCWLFRLWNNEMECEFEEPNLKQYYAQLKKLPNVKTIEVLNSNDQLLEYTASCAGADSVYSLLHPAKLLPKTIVCEGVEMSITYSPDESVTAITLKQSSRKPSVLIDNKKDDVWEAADLDLHNRNPGDDTDDSSTSTSSSSECPDVMAWQFLSSFIPMHRLTLQVVNLCSLTISGIEALTELVSAPSLTCLTFTNVETLEDVTVLLNLIKGRKQSTTLPVLTVTLENIRQEAHHGEISLSDTDITDWVEGRRDDFLDKISQAFEPKGSEDESGWEDEEDDDMMGDEDSDDSELRAFMMNEDSDMDDGMDFMGGMGDFEDHWGSDYKDLPGYYMR